MTIDEMLAREAIRHTMAVYSQAGDEFNEADYVSCFPEDGVLEFENFPGMGHLLFEGREAILKFVTHFFGAVKNGTATIPGEFMRHHLTTCRIDLVDSLTATAKTYCLYGDNGGIKSSGIYEDKFRKVGDEWLIEFRLFSVDNKG